MFTSECHVLRHNSKLDGIQKRAVRMAWHEEFLKGGELLFWRNGKCPYTYLQICGGIFYDKSDLIIEQSL